MLSASFASGSQSFEVRPSIPFCCQHQIPGKTKPRANRARRKTGKGRRTSDFLGFPLRRSVGFTRLPSQTFGPHLRGNEG